MTLRIRCEHDGQVFDATPKPYPNEAMQTRVYDETGDVQIVCPRCRRAYIRHGSGGLWLQGRPLSVLEAVS